MGSSCVTLETLPATKGFYSGITAKQGWALLNNASTFVRCAASFQCHLARAIRGQSDLVTALGLGFVGMAAWKLQDKRSAGLFRLPDHWANHPMAQGSILKQNLTELHRSTHKGEAQAPECGATQRPRPRALYVPE